jgi:hypothetical protein
MDRGPSRRRFRVRGLLLAPRNPVSIFDSSVALGSREITHNAGGFTIFYIYLC